DEAGLLPGAALALQGRHSRARAAIPRRRGQAHLSLPRDRNHLTSRPSHMRPEIMVSHAQNFEDVMLARALRDVETGFYVDVGAWDPNIETVTRYFYELGWRGINVEPAPAYHAMLETARPRDVNLRVAAGKENGRTV